MDTVLRVMLYQAILEKPFRSLSIGPRARAAVLRVPADAHLGSRHFPSGVCPTVRDVRNSNLWMVHFSIMANRDEQSECFTTRSRACSKTPHRHIVACVP